jgi:type VI protein secretion system component Hcp
MSVKVEQTTGGTFMAINAYAMFQTYKQEYMASESQVDLSKLPANDISKPFINAGPGHVFEIEDYSFDIQQTPNISSASGGVGAGKVVFNPFSITRASDKMSPLLFEMACAGTPFQTVWLGLSKAGSTPASSPMFMSFVFKLVAVKSIVFAYDPEKAKETVTFEYGGLQTRYVPQSLTSAVIGGWNQVRNVSDSGDLPIPA